MGFFKDLKNKARGLRSQVQPPMSPRPTSMGNKFERMFGISRQSPRPMPNPLGGIMGGVDFLPGYGEFPRVTLDPDLNPPTSVSPPMRMPSGGPRRLPQIMPERMPSRKPIPNFPNFFGGGLGSIFSRLMRNNPKFRGIQRMPTPPLPIAQQPVQKLPQPDYSGIPSPDPKYETFEDYMNRPIEEVRFERMPMPVGRGVPFTPPMMPNNMMAEPSLPMNFMPENMPMERFPMERPGFAGGEGVDMNMIIADQGAREGMSPPEMAAQRMREFLGETGRTVSDRDIELFGMGVLSFEDLMQRVQDSNMKNILGDSGRTISNMDRNLMQQEQMFFPQSDSLDDILEDLEKKN